MNINFYEVDNTYIDYLSPHAPHLFHNKQIYQQHERKYIGIVLQIGDIKYFAALSSFKQKHDSMKESIDLIKIKRYAVINLNLIFPVPDNYYAYVDFKAEKDNRYRDLLLSEYRIIKSIQERIRKNASVVYHHKIKYSNDTPLAKRCNDFRMLEELCKKFPQTNEND